MNRKPQHPIPRFQRTQIAEQLDFVREQLHRADETKLAEPMATVSIGALILAVAHLADAVEALDTATIRS